MRDPLLRWREEFPVLERTTYLVSHSMGAMPRSARRWVERYLRLWEERGVLAWEEWEEYLREHANRVSTLLRAPEGSVVLHQNVSTLFCLLLSALVPCRGRTRVVATELNFPSLLYALQMHRDLHVEVHLLRSPDGVTIPLEAWEDAVDSDTLAVVVDHGIFRSGFLQDVETITEVAHRHGAWVIVDAYQTAGCVPIDVQTWGADAVLGGSHKWLCGGPGAAWMYVRPERLPELRPRMVGWFGHRDPFAFELRLEPAPDAMRFATGTPGIPGLFTARAGLEVVLEVGVEAIREKSVRLTQRMIEQADALGLRVNTPRDPAQRGGMVVVDFPGAEQVARELVRRGVLVDYRPRAGIRMSAHFYTHPGEVERAFETIRELLELVAR
ncbi:MAG: aminotransferase class V-fold PLP-dependent enzyme [Armatimonadota bacterium]|nr:aminotransferase class V-fold PLP-dependent enzyme [Armatimonadota bacterium]MDR7440137.1 aminotransferase class V-fold PLP-dependent enzyme [Armatimonadota bacterium]MDR7562933.1 aminotransferase class V-fold PLP-dependent enzyme [Armatimonadota bacterium]MDR7567998.1 aminotransferase class V-fold PLP-dependent enzyme [Armatimonadota bacterium]MDR7601429.1 aminotransferase class V-fold PLP-dependent enzyme [Armatimonadota bacterium]